MTQPPKKPEKPKEEYDFEAILALNKKRAEKEAQKRLEINKRVMKDRGINPSDGA